MHKSAPDFSLGLTPPEENPLTALSAGNLGFGNGCDESLPGYMSKMTQLALGMDQFMSGGDIIDQKAFQEFEASIKESAFKHPTYISAPRSSENVDIEPEAREEEECLSPLSFSPRLPKVIKVSGITKPASWSYFPESITVHPPPWNPKNKPVKQSPPEIPDKAPEKIPERTQIRDLKDVINPPVAKFQNDLQVGMVLEHTSPRLARKYGMHDIHTKDDRDVWRKEVRSFQSESENANNRGMLVRSPLMDNFLGRENEMATVEQQRGQHLEGLGGTSGMATMGQQPQQPQQLQQQQQQQQHIEVLERMREMAGMEQQQPQQQQQQHQDQVDQPGQAIKPAPRPTRTPFFNRLIPKWFNKPAKEHKSSTDEALEIDDLKEQLQCLESRFFDVNCKLLVNISQYQNIMNHPYIGHYENGTPEDFKVDTIRQKIESLEREQKQLKQKIMAAKKDLKKRGH